jgi:hypothetical protein
MLLIAETLVAPASAAERSPVSDLFDAMRSGVYEQEGFYEFPQLGTNDIPELLKHASRTNQLVRIPVNGYSSMHKFACSEGMIALWLIEGIRVGGRFPSQLPECYDRSKSVPAGAWYAEADQDAIVEAYSAWWKQTQERSKDIDPLDGSSMTWRGGHAPYENNQPNNRPELTGAPLPESPDAQP